MLDGLDSHHADIEVLMREVRLVPVEGGGGGFGDGLESLVKLDQLVIRQEFEVSSGFANGGT